MERVIINKEKLRKEIERIQNDYEGKNNILTEKVKIYHPISSKNFGKVFRKLLPFCEKRYFRRFSNEWHRNC